MARLKKQVLLLSQMKTERHSKNRDPSIKDRACGVIPGGLYLYWMLLLSYSFAAARGELFDGAKSPFMSRADRITVTNMMTKLGVKKIEKIETRDGYFFWVSGDTQCTNDICVSRRISFWRHGKDRSFEKIADNIVTNVALMVENKPKFVTLMGAGRYTTTT